MTTLFKGDTNGGANRIFIEESSGEMKIAGEGVGGRQEVSMKMLADVFGAISVKDRGNEAKFNADEFSGETKDYTVKKGDTDRDGDGQDDVVVKIGGEGVAGNYALKFGNQKEADSFQDFLAENQDIFMYAMSGGRVTPEKSLADLIGDADVKDNFNGFNPDQMSENSVSQPENDVVKVGGAGVAGNINIDFGGRTDDAAEVAARLETREGQEEFEGLFT